MVLINGMTTTSLSFFPSKWSYLHLIRPLLSLFPFEVVVFAPISTTFLSFSLRSGRIRTYFDHFSLFFPSKWSYSHLFRPLFSLFPFEVVVFAPISTTFLSFSLRSGRIRTYFDHFSLFFHSKWLYSHLIRPLLSLFPF